MQSWGLALFLLVVPVLSGQLFAVHGAADTAGHKWQQPGNTSAHVLHSSRGRAATRMFQSGITGRRMLQDAVLGTASTVPFRIVGGVTAMENRFKYVCSLRDGSDQHYCGCTLIAPNVILTAAHCLNQTDLALHNPIVEVGRYYRTAANGSADNGTADSGNDFDRLYCSTSVVNPGWTFSAAQNDLGLCFLNGSSQYTPVALASAANVVSVGTNVSILGWGATVEGGQGSDVLMINTVPLTDRTSCNITYGGKVHNTQLCAGVPQGGEDACQGDSGGPMILEGAEPYQDVQLGIVSFGAGCGRPGIPGVYTDVRAYRGYIAQQFQANGVAYAPVTQGYLPSTEAPATSTAPVVAPAVAAASPPASGGSGSFVNVVQSPSSPALSAPPPTTTTASGPTVECVNTFFGQVCRTTGSSLLGSLFGVRSAAPPAQQQAASPAAVRSAPVDATVRSFSGSSEPVSGAGEASGASAVQGQALLPLVRAATGFYKGFTQSLQQSG